MSRVISPWETSITMKVKLYGLYCLMAMAAITRKTDDPFLATPYHALHAENYLMVPEILGFGAVDDHEADSQRFGDNAPKYVFLISALDVAHSIKDTTKHYVDHPKPKIVPVKIERLQSSENENEIAKWRVIQGLFTYGHHIKASKDKTSDKNRE